VDELKHRAGGKRESGAFLLGTIKGRVRRIEQFLFYDDVDPTCFAHGIVEFDGSKFGVIWQKCRDDKQTVVADVHVHPGHYGQSASDKHNPMIAEVGHLAVIVPDFAARARLPGKIGVHEYLGARNWCDRSALGDRVFHVGWWPR
jgi:proteasome lid subunit RPN8/RPN11